MIDPEQRNNLVLKLSGKAEVSKELQIGRNYDLRASGTVISLTEADNNNGSHTIYYKYQPVVIELVTDKGESIKAKDPRSLSQLFRARVWAIWNKKPDGQDFNTYYEGLMNQMIQHADEVCEMFEVK